MTEKFLHNSCPWLSIKPSTELFQNVYYTDRPMILDQLFFVIHNVFRFELIALYGLLVALYLCYRMRKMGDIEYNDTSQKYIDILTRLFIAICCNAVIIIIVKKYFSCARPLSYINITELHKYHIETWDSSFPSGHVALVCTLLLALWKIMNNQLKLASMVILILTVISRIGLALHFPQDIVGATLICLISHCISILLSKTKIIRKIENIIVSKIVKPYIIKRNTVIIKK